MTDGPINVADYGFNTTAIEEAWTDANAQNRPLYFPGATGRTYVYHGPGLSGANIAIFGDDPQTTVIELGTGYLIDDSGVWGNLQVERIRTVNGAGVIRNTHTGTMVQGKMVVRDCEFRNYSAAAISTNTVDGPNWTIENNLFEAANSTTSMGVALSGLTDSCRIVGNSFLLNRIHIKLAEGGNNAYVLNNDFLRFATGTDRTDIWVVPDADGTNAGTGLYVGPNKFGNEFLDTTDRRVLYADQVTGVNFGDRLPSTAASTGFIRGHRFQGCAVFGGGGSPNAPFVYSTTPNVFGSAYQDLSLGGTPPTYILQHQVVPTALSVSDPRFNLISQVTFDGFHPTGLTGFSATNSPGTVKLVDPVNVMGGPQVQFLHSCSTGPVGGGSTVYFGPNGERADWLASLWAFDRPVRIRKLSIAGSVAPGGSASVAVALRKQNADTAMTLSIGSASFGGAIAGDILINPQEYIDVRVTPSATAANSRYRVVLEYQVV
jgi:hypothetical protein